MSNFYDRLLEEKAQLDEKIEKLECFVNSDNFKELDETNKNLLNIQLPAMKTYSNILETRIIGTRPNDR